MIYLFLFWRLGGIFNGLSNFLCLRMKFWNDSYAGEKKTFEILRLHSSFFYVATLLFVIARCKPRVCDDRTRGCCHWLFRAETQSISGMSHKVSVWRATQPPVLLREPGQHGKSPSGTTQKHPRQNTKAFQWVKVGVMVWQSWRVTGFKGQSPMRMEKSVKWAFEPLWSLLMSHWSLMLKDQSHALMHILWSCQWQLFWKNCGLWGKKHLQNEVARKAEKAKILKSVVRIHCFGELYDLWNNKYNKIQGTRLCSHFTKWLADWQFNPLKGCFHSFRRQRLAECLLFSWSHVTELRGRRLGRRTLVISPSAKRTMSHTTGTI